MLSESSLALFRLGYKEVCNHLPSLPGSRVAVNGDLHNHYASGILPRKAPCPAKCGKNRRMRIATGFGIEL